jgi:hypothetical protein
VNLAVETVAEPSAPFGRRSWLLRLPLLLLAFSPAFVALYIVLAYGVDFPYWDQLDPDIAGIYVKYHAGTLGFADMMAQHNEHRQFFPRFLYLGLALLTHWNPVAEMVASWVIVVITSIGLLFLTRRAGPGVWRN